MPVYAYACERCGPFEALRPVAEAGRDAPCPSCQQPATRRFTAPAILGAGAARREALARRAEPRVVRRERVADGEAESPQRQPGGVTPAPLQRQPGGVPWALGG